MLWFNIDIWYCFFKKNGPTTASFSLIFGLFKQTLQLLQQIYVKKCTSSIRYQESNPQPSECESLPITTSPGLPPNIWYCLHVLIVDTGKLLNPKMYSLNCWLKSIENNSTNICTELGWSRHCHLLKFSPIKLAPVALLISTQGDSEILFDICSC